MRILLVTAYYPPEVRSAAQLMRELAESLTRRGHTVTVVTAFPPANMEGDDAVRAAVARFRGRMWMRERQGRLEIVRIATLAFNKMPPLVRSFGHFALAAALSAGGLRCGRHDVIWAYSPPPTLGLTCFLLSRLWRAPFVVNVQDLYPQALVDLGLLRNRAAIRLFQAMEQFVYHRAAGLVVHSEGNRVRLLALGAPPERVVTIPNWVDSAAVSPGDRLNGFRAQHGLGDRFVVLFAGVMGYAQDLEVIVDAAARVRDRHDILFLLVGDGVRKAEAQGRVQAQGLDNVRFLPLQAAETYPEVVGAADLCLVTLRRDVTTPVVPSKILGFMAGARPIVAALPPGNDAVMLIDAARCGLCVPAGDEEALAEAIIRLHRDGDLRTAMGRRGRLFAQTHLDRNVLIRRCEELMAATVARQHQPSR